MLDEFLNFLGLGKEENNAKQTQEVKNNDTKEEISEEQICIKNAHYQQDISEKIDYDTNEIVTITKTITPIDNNIAVLNIKTERKPKGLK